MAVRRPVYLDLTTGELTRMAAEDFVNEVDFVNVTNNTGASIPKVTPVYQTGVADEADEANASALSTAKVLGLTVEAIANTAQGDVLTDGRVVATTGEWDAVTGQVGGLTPGARYFLDTTAGMLTTTPPSADGQVVAPVGQAKSATEFEVTIGTRIVL